LFAALIVWHLSPAFAAGSQPNVIVFLLDDLGYADVGFQGFEASSQVYTPNIDRLAASGTVFTNGYVAFSTCGPSRASLMTGRSGSRFGFEENDAVLPAEEITIPELLKPLGYQSAALGKWHLGEGKGQLPTDRGFDYYWGDIPAQKDYFMARLDDPPSWRDKARSARAYGRYVTDAYTDEALEFIKRSEDKPFFAYIAYNAPHSPFRVYESLIQRVVEARPEWAPVYERMKGQSTHKPGKPFPAYDFGKFQGEGLDEDILRLCYLGMLPAADDGMGKILDTLEEQGLRENTLIFFMSDNGAALSRPNDLGGVNMPLRGGKGSCFDGGVRVPFVLSWPGRIDKGAKSDLLISSMDILPTVVSLAGGKLPSDRAFDGVNLAPHFNTKEPYAARDMLYFRRDRRKDWAVRVGDFKWLVDNQQIESSHGALFNIGAEPAESQDLAGRYPDRLEEIRRKYQETILPQLVELQPASGDNQE